MRLSPVLLALMAGTALLGACSKTPTGSSAPAATAQATTPAPPPPTPATTNWAAVWTDTQTMPVEHLKQDASARAAWHAVVPRKFAKMDWIYDLAGGSAPPRIMTENGQAFAVGAVCERSSCGSNQVGFVIQLGGGHAVGGTLIAPDKGGWVRTYFGNPTPVEKGWLDAQ